MRTSELTGAMLDYWVGKAEKLDVYKDGEFVEVKSILGTWSAYHPSSCWEHGGPLIDKYRITPYLNPRGRWDGYNKPELDMHESNSKTPLQAICRAVVRAEFGDEVQEGSESNG